MANTIIIKNGAGAPPDDALAVAELGFDTENKKLYIGDSLKTNFLINSLSINLEEINNEVTNSSKPQSPLRYEEKYFYPLTTADQVILDDNSRLNQTLEQLVYTEEYGGDVATVALNADTLGGKTVDEFAQAPLRKSATILASGWSSSVPYTQTLTVDGITVDDTPHISPVYSDDLTIAISQKEAWGMVSRAKTGNNTIIFMCFEEKPAADINVQIGVYR